MAMALLSSLLPPGGSTPGRSHFSGLAFSVRDRSDEHHQLNPRGGLEGSRAAPG